MREWALTFEENDHSPAYHCRGAHRSAQLQPLGIPSWRPGIHTPWTDRQFRDSHAGQYGCVDNCPGGAAPAVVAVLRGDGDDWFGDRRVCHVQAGAQGREGIALAQVFGQDDEEGLRDIRAMGICRHCYSRGVAAPNTHCAVSAGSGSHAIFLDEIPASDDAGTDCKVPDFGVSGRAVWTKNVAFAIASRPPGVASSGWVECRDRSCLLLYSCKQKEKRRKELNNLETDRLPCRSTPMNVNRPRQFGASVPAPESRLCYYGTWRIREELIQNWNPAVTGVPPYSYRNATIGSTRIARRAGT